MFQVSFPGASINQLINQIRSSSTITNHGTSHRVKKDRSLPQWDYNLEIDMKEKKGVRLPRKAIKLTQIQLDYVFHAIKVIIIALKF